MNWEAIAAIGQMLGSIAVFVTLGYLAVQIGHARGEVRRSINQSRSETVRQFYMTYATDERLDNVRQKSHILLGGQPTGFARELMERTGMTAEEATAVFWDQMAWWTYRTQTIPYLDELPHGERKSFEFGVKHYRTLPTATLWYERNRSYLNPDAVRYVDNLLAQSG